MKKYLLIAALSLLSAVAVAATDDLPIKVITNYTIDAHKPDFIPEKVYDDGKFTYIEFGKRTPAELPIFFELSSENQIVVRNAMYEQNENRIRVDNVFQRGELRLGSDVVFLTRGSVDNRPCLTGVIRMSPLGPPGFLQSCVDGQYTSKSGASATILISVKILRNNKLLSSSDMTTTDGVKTHFSMRDEKRGAPTAGMLAIATPTISSNGKILVDFNIQWAERWAQKKVDGVDYFGLQQSATLVDGGELILHLDQENQSGEKTSSKSAYQVKISAKKI